MKILCLLIVVNLTIFAQINEFKGISKPYKEIEISSHEPGILKKMEVLRGDKVRKGQILAVLDYSILEASLRIAQAKARSIANLKAKEIELKLAKKKLDNLLKLQKRNLAKTNEVYHAKAQLALAKTKLLSVKENLEISKLEVKRIKLHISKHYIKSPADGVIREIMGEPGENVSSRSPIFKIVQTDKLKIIAHADSQKTYKLKTGQKVGVVFTSQKQKGKGTISFIDPVIDMASNTVLIIIVIENKHNKFPIGTQCRIIPIL